MMILIYDLIKLHNLNLECEYVYTNLKRLPSKRDDVSCCASLSLDCIKQPFTYNNHKNSIFIYRFMFSRYLFANSLEDYPTNLINYQCFIRKAAI